MSLDKRCVHYGDKRMYIAPFQENYSETFLTFTWTYQFQVLMIEDASAASYCPGI